MVSYADQCTGLVGVSGMQPVRAAIFTEPGTPLALEEIALHPLQPHDVRIRITATSLCQTDVAIRRGDHDYGAPIIMGHEASGIVQEVGVAVDRFTVGDTVISSSAPSCGRCIHCTNGRPHICVLSSSVRSVPRASRPDGSIATGLFGLGTFAEEMVVNEASIVAVDTSLAPESLSLIGCGVTTGLSAALNRATIPVGGSVVVIGCGTVGLSAIIGARIAGASTIIAIDPLAERRADAGQRGATHQFDSQAPNLAESIAQLTAGHGVDVTIDAVSRPETVAQAQAFTRRSGEIVMIGMPPKDAAFEIAALPFFLSEHRLSSALFGSANIRRDFPAFVRLAEQGQLDLAGFVSRTMPLDQVNAGLDMLERGEVLRAVLLPGTQQ